MPSLPGVHTDASNRGGFGEGVSSATIARLSLYHQCLVEGATSGVPAISSDRLAELAAVSAATVRRDLASLGIQGTRGIGYDIKYLVQEIRGVLGVADAWAVVIVGAGNLGRALANYAGLAARGFPVRAIVDVDPALVGTSVAGMIVDHLDDIDRLVGERDLGVGVITTPAAVAQDVADRLVAAGLGSILNFTATPLVVPAGVEVRQVDLATELQILSFYRRRTAAAAAGTGVPLES